MHETGAGNEIMYENSPGNRGIKINMLEYRHGNTLETKTRCRVLELGYYGIVAAKLVTSFNSTRTISSLIANRCMFLNRFEINIFERIGASHAETTRKKFCEIRYLIEE